jgi:transcriptional regulator with XRE-family HTH domain
MRQCITIALMPLTTSGLCALRARLLSDPSLTQTALATELRVTQQAVSGWLNGRCLPAFPQMLELEERFGIAPRAWALPAFGVYVAAPYADALHVRRVHDLLRRVAIEPTSQWAEDATGPEALDELPLSDVREMAERNDEYLLASHALLVVPRDNAGAEMFAEARIALEYEIPVVWVGARRPLSAYRPGVVRVGAISEAVEKLVSLAAIAFPQMGEEDAAHAAVWSAVAPPERAIAAQGGEVAHAT